MYTYFRQITAELREVKSYVRECTIYDSEYATYARTRFVKAPHELTFNLAHHNQKN